MASSTHVNCQPPSERTEPRRVNTAVVWHVYVFEFEMVFRVTHVNCQPPSERAEPRRVNPAVVRQVYVFEFEMVFRVTHVNCQPPSNNCTHNTLFTCF